jgi:hypothetical protein
MKTFDKFSNFSIEDTYNYVSTLTEKINKKNINLFLIEIFSSSLTVDKFYECEFTDFAKLYKLEHGEILQQAVINKFFPKDTTHITHLKDSIKYLDFVMGHILNEEIGTKDNVPYVLDVIQALNLDKKQYNQHVHTLIEYLESFDFTWDNDLFDNIKFSLLDERYIINLMACVKNSAQLYEHIYSLNSKFKLSTENSEELIHYFLIEKQKPQYVLDFLEKYHYKELLNNYDIQKMCLLYQPKILKLAHISLSDEIIDDLIFEISEYSHVSKLMKNISSFFGKDYIHNYLSEAFNSKEKINHFIADFIKIHTFNQKQLNFIDLHYDYFASFGCPFTLVRDKIYTGGIKHYQEREALELLNPYLLESEKRLLDFKMKDSKDNLKTKRIKI